MFLNCCLNMQLHHPSALNVFDQIIHKARGKKIITFLDYDGTLSPIVADPEKAYMTEKVFFLFLPPLPKQNSYS